MTVDLDEYTGGDVTERVTSLVRPAEGLVSHRIYTDPEIYQAEIERVWKGTWLWAGHESEVPAPGDFVTRTVGTVPIIISRTADGDVAVSLNVCAHRGNQVCQLERGHTPIFRCPYHGWSYKNSGELAGVPYPKSYSDISEIKRLRLPRPASVDDYRGLIFISHSADVPPLDEYLGTIAPELDRIFELSPTGRLKFDTGYNSMVLDCNWKVFQENGADNYHSNFTHISAFTTEEQRRGAAAISSDESLGIVVVHRYGHTEIDFREQEKKLGMTMRTGNAGAPEADVSRHFADLTAAVGEAEATRRFNGSPPTLYLYPSLLVIQQDLRRVEPVAPGKSLLFQYPTLLDGVPDGINLQRLSRHEAPYGPAGFIVTDDMEVWARTQRAVNGDPDGWIALTRGIHREQLRDNGVIFSHITDETAIRGMWREYIRLMTKAPPQHRAVPEDV